MKLNQFKSDIELGPFEKNIGEMLLQRAEKFSERIAVQEKKGNNYAKVSWNNIYTQIKQLGLGLMSLGLEKGDKIAVLSRDCSEILSLELACMSIGCIFVPFFVGYYPKQIEYVLSHSDPKLIIVSDNFQLEKILSTMATGRIEKYFILDYTDKYIESTKIFDFKLIYKDVEDYSPFFQRVSEVEPEDNCLLIYTSGGTTGISKGVQLTHSNVLGQQKALSQVWDITENDILLSYFPWHQSQGIVEKFTSLYSGACLTIDRTPGIHVDTLPDNLKVCQPTVYFGSAKIFNELVYEMNKNKNLEEAFFHDNVRFAFASSSPTREVINFFKKKNVPLLQGWGLTETLQYVTVTTKKEWEINNSGFPIPGVEIKSEDEDELWVRGINVMKGYYKDEERTEKSLTDDDWFKTGDAGLLSENGLKILGQIDSLFYLKDKTKVYASKIEQTVENSSIYILHCVVFGEDRPFMGALLFPYAPALKTWFQNKNAYCLPLADMLDTEDVIELYRSKIRLINEINLGKEEAISYFTLLENEISVKTGELTSGFTVVRKQILNNNSELVDAFYLGNEALPELKARIIKV